MEADERRTWTLLTSHGHVLVEIARNPRARVRDISAIIGITERATQAIIADLERAGYVERIRMGRRTHYVLHPDNPFRHSAQDGLQVGPFLDLLTGATEPGALTPTPTPQESFLAAAVQSEPLPVAADQAPAVVEPLAAQLLDGTELAAAAGLDLTEPAPGLLPGAAEAGLLPGAMEPGVDVPGPGSPEPGTL